MYSIRIRIYHNPGTDLLQSAHEMYMFRAKRYYVETVMQLPAKTASEPNTPERF